jgi:hypothetical protein
MREITVTIYRPGVSYPDGETAILTADHPRSNYDLPVLVGEATKAAYAPGDLPPGTYVQLAGYTGWTAEREAALTAWAGVAMEEPYEECDGGGYFYRWRIPERG